MSAKRSREEGFGHSSDSSQSLTDLREAGRPVGGLRGDRTTAEDLPVDLRGCWDEALRVELGLGWKPQLGLKTPFPLVFPDAVTRAVRGLPGWVYLGARPAHAYDLHLGLSSAQSYSVQQDGLRSFREAVRKQLVAFESARPQQQPDALAFDSYFESGNCDAVRRSRADAQAYELFLRPDTGTRGHAQWFYFSVAASRPTQATFLIRNMCKPSSVFGRGGRPFFSRDNLTWHALESPVEYCETACSPDEDWLPRSRSLNTLRFSFDFEKGERVYFAYSPPYSFGSLQRFLERAQTQAGESLLRRETLCLSLAGLAVPMLRCGAGRDKPAVLVLARAHPGETSGSHMMQGFMEALLSESQAARSLRDCFEFVLLPMLNPDGVVAGNFRTDLVGDDLNRQFARPSARFHPAVHHLVYAARQLRAHRRLVFCLDLHGHSTRPGVFAYGPQLAATDPLAGFAKVLPWLVARKTDMFLFDKCTFHVPKQKMKTARAFFLFQQGTRLSAEAKLTYTIEASTALRIEDGRLLPFSVPKYQEMGRRLLEGLFDTLRVGLRHPPFVEFAFDNSPPVLPAHHPLKAPGPDFRSLLLQINQHANATSTKPDPEGGSDSESSADDISKKQKLKLLQTIERALDREFSPTGQQSDRKTRRTSKPPAKSQVRIKLLQQAVLKQRPASRKETSRTTPVKEASYLKPKDRSFLEDPRLPKHHALAKADPCAPDRFVQGYTLKDPTALREDATSRLWKPPLNPKPPALHPHKHRPLEFAVSQKLIASGRWLGEEGGKFKIQTDPPGLPKPKKQPSLLALHQTPHGLPDQTGKPHGQSAPLRQVKISNLILDASDFIPAKQRAPKPDQLTQTRFASLSRPGLK